MSKIWNLFRSPVTAKLIAFAWCVFFFIARLGETGSYWQAFNAAVLFFAIWSLGRMSVKDQS